MNTDKWQSSLKTISMQSQRSRSYLGAALALTSVIPMLSFCLIVLSLFTDVLPDSNVMRLGVAAAGSMAGVAGYMMLRVYPANLQRVRDYLSRIALDDLPEHAELLPGEQDFSDIEFYLNKVISGLNSRIVRLDEALTRSQQMIETIEEQSEKIMVAERQRVMFESLGAACHHIGQPMTVLSLYLTRMRDLHEGEDEHGELGSCLEAVESVSAILKKLMRVSEYRTVPYATFCGEGETPSDRLNILDIERRP